MLTAPRRFTSWGCSGCPTRWTSLSEAHCPACHAHFRTMRAADRHRRHGQCLDPATLTGSNGSAVFLASSRGTRLDQATTWALA